MIKIISKITAYTQHNSYLLKRVSIFILVITIQIMFLVFFSFNQDFISNVRISHINNLYVPKFVYSVTEFKSNLDSGLANVLNSNKHTSIEAEKSQEYAANSIPVLLYHGSVEEPDGYSLHTKIFVDQMLSLKENGYTAISFEEFGQIMKGEVNPPDKPILLTFDDGRKDSYYSVNPIIKALNFKATMFILPKYSLSESTDSNYYLEKSELVKMVKSGVWSVQSHGYDAHTYYSIDDKNNKAYYYANRIYSSEDNRLETSSEFDHRVREDLVKSKKIIESNLGNTVTAIAYPFGQYGQNTFNHKGAIMSVPYLSQEIYTHSFYQVNPADGLSFQDIDDQAFMIKRIEVRPNWTAKQLLNILESGAEKTLPYSNSFNDSVGWIKFWGDYVNYAGTLDLISSKFVTETYTYLDGSQYWENYQFELISRLEGQGEVILTAGVKDRYNYDSCNFSDSDIKIKTRRNSKESIIFANNINFSLTSSNRYGIIYRNGLIACLFNNDVVAYTKSDVIDGSGGIGVKLFDLMGSGRLIIDSVEVKKLFSI